MSARWSLLLALSILVAQVSWGQAVEFLDGQGNAQQDAYFEGSTAYLRVVDPGASSQVSVDVTSLAAGDFETLTLAETSPGSAVFEGSIRLALGPGNPDGILQTYYDPEQYPGARDFLTATYGSASDSATTRGSSTEILDASGNSVATFLVGDTLYFKVIDYQANQSAGVDSTGLYVRATPTYYGDEEFLSLAETGPDTSVFEGSIPTQAGTGPRYDSILNVDAGQIGYVWHEDLGGTYSSIDDAKCISALPITLEFRDAQGSAPSEAFEFSWLQVQATDGAAAGLGSTEVAIRSTLRGDVEPVTLWESSTPGLFLSNFFLEGTLSTQAPSTDGVFEVTEAAGPPLQRDTVQATWDGCSNPPCPSPTIAMIGSQVRITDMSGNDVQAIPTNSGIQIEVTDHSIGYRGGTTASATATTGLGDSEQLVLQRPEGSSEVYRGTFSFEIAPPVSNDGCLQVRSFDTVAVEHQDPLGLSSSSDSVIVGSALLSFLDRWGDETSELPIGGDMRLQAVSEDSNVNPGAADSVTVTVTAWGSFYGNDTELLQLVETGPDANVFVGAMPSAVYATPVPGDGVLQVTPDASNQVEASIDQTTIRGWLVPGRVRFIDSNGAEAATVAPGAYALVEIESDFSNWDSTAPDMGSARIRSLASGDEEWLTLAETGPDTAIFRGSIRTSAASPVAGNEILEVALGETLEASLSFSALADAVDQAVVGGEPPGGPPVAADDSATTPDGTEVYVNVLANDTEPDGEALHVESFTQGTRGGVTDGGNGYLVYAPQAGFVGTDTFSYAVADAAGESDTASVTVNVELVNDPPDAQHDTAYVNEDEPVLLTVTTNDRDPELEPLSIVSVGQGNGKGASELVDADLGQIRYTPSANAWGSDAFLYTVADPHGATDWAVVFIEIVAQADAPIAAADAAATSEDTVVAIDVLANDSDPDGETPSIVNVVQQPPFGTASVGEGKVNYAPSTNYHGTDSFTYQITDGTGRYATATVSVTITPAPDTPLAIADSLTTNEDTPVSLAVLANDSDPDGDLLTVVSVAQGLHGVATANANGSITYEPQPDYNGPDAFTYTIQDPTGRTASAQVSVTVVGVNDAPVAASDAEDTAEDTAVSVDVLANDSDVDGDALSITGATGAANGQVAIAGSTVIYTPSPNFNGADTFTYSIADGQGGSASATASVTVAAVNDAPVAAADAINTSEDIPASVEVLANDGDVDGDVLVVVASTQGAHGSVSFAGGTATYAPAADSNGADSFSYTVGDGRGGSATAVVVVAVGSVNDPPSAAADAAATNEDTGVTIPVLANDGDVDGDGVAVNSVSAAAHGSVNFGASSVSYAPNANYNGSDSFNYSISDGQGGSATATVTIDIAAVNDAPTAVNDVAATKRGTAVTIAVLANDSDLDGDSLRVASVTQPSSGSVAILSGGTSLRYAPPANFNGVATFTYQVSDSRGGAGTATVMVTVTKK